MTCLKYRSLNKKLGGAIVLLALFWTPLPAQKVDRSKPPELGPPPKLELPPLQRATLSNGLPVLFLEKNQVPLVQVNLIVKTGSVHDPAGKTGLADMVSTMLKEGAGQRNALELADAIDFLGATLSTSAGYHTSSVRLNTPASKLDAALALMGAVALQPSFPAEELERKRKESLTALLQAHDQPATIAVTLFNRVLYGDDHPYGASSVGTEAALRAIQVADLQQFHRTFYRSNNAALVVVGAVKLAELLPKLETIFGGWEPGKIPAATLPQPKQVSKRTVYLVDKPGSAQSVVRIGRIGVPRLTGDYYSLVVMNTILGGSFTSRLNQNLREQHGYTYGAGSAFAYRESAGPFFAAAAVQTDVTDKALVEFMKELRGIRQQIAEAELARAKNYVALQYPGDFQSVASIAGELGELVEYNLPDHYVNTYIDNILGVSKQQVLAMAKKHVVPEQMAVVIVGDRSKIEQGVVALKLGNIEFLSIEDVLGKPPVLQGTD